MESNDIDLIIKSFEGMQAVKAKNLPQIVVNPKKVVDTTDKAPVFIHPEINDLYRLDYTIKQDVLQHIKTFPRDTLIRDLIAVIYDSIARFDILKNLPQESNSGWSIIHALLLLRDIEAEEALEVILDFLSQEEDLIEYWLGDFLLEEGWQVIAACGKNNLARLNAFMKESGRIWWSKAAVSGAVSQLFLHKQISRETTINWMSDVICYYIDNRHIENIFDSENNGSLVCDLLDLKAVELSSLIQRMFDLGLVDETFAGDWEYVEKRLLSPDRSNFSHIVRELKSSKKIYENYQKASEKNSTYSLKRIDDDFDDDFDDEVDDLFEPMIPFVRATPKIGRNHSCYCGSGKKYKKCHGINA